jgi:hypothetical protein
MFTKSIAAQRPFKLALIASFAMVAAAVSAPSLATDTSATSTAEVMEPITLTKVSDMQFGRFAGTTGGALFLSTGGARTPSTGVVLGGGAVSAAVFGIQGSPNAVFGVSLEGSSTKLIGAGGDMNLALESNLTGTLLTGNSALDNGGSAVLQVGGTLTVNPSQPGGIYSGNVAVSVNYN